MIIILLIFLLVILLLIQLQKSTEAFENYNLPKIVWSYWDSELPTQIQQFVKHNTKVLKGWKYIVVTKENESTYINPEDKPNTNKLSIEHYSDWVRLYLLKNYGGVWMDISIILNESLDEFYNQSIVVDSELSGFRGKHFETTDIPVIENWFIMAPRGSEVIQLWLEEFEKAIDMGFLAYKKEALKNDVNFQNIFGKSMREVYLTQHGCLQVVLQKRLAREPSMYLEDAVDSMFKIHDECKWDKTCLHKKINDFTYSKNIPYIKLRGSDRKGLDLALYFDN